VLKRLFTSESVTEGHPDKMADQISDAILDAILAQDSEARVACETLVTTGLVFIAGEISTSAYVDFPRVARGTVLRIGYNNASYGIDGRTCGVMVSIDEQAADIARGVDKSLEFRQGDAMGELDAQGAGDQGMMFGFACNETEDLMPLPIWLAHRLAHRLSEVRRAGIMPYVRPDGKTQVTVEYDEKGRPVRLDTVLISAQHDGEIHIDTLLRPDLVEHVLKPMFPEGIDTSDVRILVNPTGRFEMGGPHADVGLTGRKIIVDTYGGYSRHGGGAFSGKDPSKVDRSAAYAARWVAKNVVAAGLADKCEIQVAYAIGKAAPVSVMTETFGTSQIDPDKLNELVVESFDLRPAALLRDLNLRRPIYEKTASYGHFGRREPEFSWERTDKAEHLRAEGEKLA